MLEVPVTANFNSSQLDQHGTKPMHRFVKPLCPRLRLKGAMLWGSLFSLSLSLVVATETVAAETTEGRE